MASSLGKRVGAEVKIESTYGTAPSMSHTTDAVLLYEQTNPVSVQRNALALTPLRTSLTKNKQIIGRSLQKFAPVSYLQGPENTNNSLPWRLGVLLRACGLQQLIQASSSIVYKPRSSSFESAAMLVWLDGFKHTITGAYGSFQVAGNAAEGMKITFDMTGLYPAANAVITEAAPSQTLESSKPLPWINAGLYIKKTSDTVTLTPAPVVKSFSFDAGVQVSERKDANAAKGLFGLLITDRSPTCQVVIEVDTVHNIVFMDDWEQAVIHHINFTLGTGTDNIVEFELPELQLTNVEYSEDVSLRTYTLSYAVTSQTDDAEYLIKFRKF